MPFHYRSDLVSALHSVVLCDGDIFTNAEAMLGKTENLFVVGIPRGVGKGPAPRHVDEQSAFCLSAAFETPDGAQLTVLGPRFSIESS